MTARWLDLSPGQYHAPVPEGEIPALSHSLAVELLQRSPRHARRKWMSRGQPDPKSEEQAERRRRLEWGTLVHHHLLGGRDDRIVVACSRAPAAPADLEAALAASTGDGPRPANDGVRQPFADWRTKAAQQERKRLYAAGQVPVLAHQDEAARVAAARLRAKLREAGLDIEDNAARHRYCEAPIAWEEPAVDVLGREIGIVDCRAMLDFVDLAAGLVVDVKTTESAHPEKIRRVAHDYGYDVQAAAYVSAIEAVRPSLAGRVRFVTAFCETSTGDVVLMPFEEGGLHFGRGRWMRAVRIWHGCVTSGVWPGYPTSVPWEPTDWQRAAEERLRLEESYDFAAHAEPRAADSDADPPEERYDDPDSVF